MGESFTPIKTFMITALPGGHFRHNDERIEYDEIPVGAMWYAPWRKRTGPDGRFLYCRVPGAFDWGIDGFCSNCPKRHDLGHYCWVRHGTPPNITVDKDGETCSAGPGSIVVPNWHGMLKNGYLALWGQKVPKG